MVRACLKRGGWEAQRGYNVERQGSSVVEHLPSLWPWLVSRETKPKIMQDEESLSFTTVRAHMGAGRGGVGRTHWGVGAGVATILWLK